MTSVVPDRYREYTEEHYDAIVVGAGIGGLTSAALLAQKGLSVLVVEMHYELGGCATVFSRVGKGQGYEFDVGLHYIGDCEREGLIPRILRGAGVEHVDFIEQDPAGFDSLYFPDFEFRIPRGAEQFKQRLLELFPREKKGIERYFKLLDQVWSIMGVHGRALKALQVYPRCMLALRHINATVAEFLDTCTHDQRLRAILTGQLGVYHQPPSRASLMGHAGVTMHFMQGSFYPAGGGQVISDRLAEAIESKGNKILLRTKVQRMLIEGGRVVGVEFSNKALGTRCAYAPIVISNADLKQTMLNLVGESEISTRTAERTKAYEMSPGMGVVYLGIRRDLAKEGMRNTNLRIYPSYDFETAYRDVQNDVFSERPHVFVGNASLKDPHNPKVAPEGITNLQLMSVTPSSFSAWKITEQEYKDGSYRKNPRYLELKEKFAAAVIRETERVIPNLSRDIVFQEVSTPITMMRYTDASNGTSYGMSLIPSQFLHNRPGAKTDIKGLLMCGANMRNGHGIFGAMTSGVEAAAMVVGKRFGQDVLSGRF
ncbi:NAD(P)/FAD-dependent oxidoreductase [Undibacterium cyanobacteriorum]|uniref:NAD(P)/FAD-dependent oxidoreductase n=1 Tax=Undibacterium cyanobacteriorum TaxID=3073561 RepID=A0ABY9RMA8_9BURK|nr:NAD(P)/FAD-dependent oxidoreductase [Undibacterium sp. 20NA77.5]WMW81552.1 NAD(P)/FAD-dependent oxidoreductase [Undibacterium sp. 20NA77.5]